ncbi:MAG: hypothetical protein AB1705_03865 [Verrucomicrobiota bacterium]
MNTTHLTLLASALLAANSGLPALASEEYEQPPISYSARPPQDVIARLEKRLRSGDARLEGNPKEILRALLQELQVPVESQILVFSKTSLQRGRIEPKNPRSMFFSDTCYVGWVPGGLMEVASIDPTLGPIFYAFDPYAAPTPDEPRFVRDSDCLSCHGGSFVRGVPGVFARSVFTDELGEPMLRHGSQVVDHRTPFNERWGGWYVTGKHGKETHRGNVFATEKKGELTVDLERGANVTNLRKYFETENYLTDTSDIVALMVFEYQTAAHNALTRAAFNCRRMLAYQKNLQRDLGEPVTDEPSYDSVKRVFDSATQDALDHLLFKDEAPLPKGGIQGSRAFQDAFTANARPARDGSSLKDLDLKTRLFQNRCGYVIYSEAFLNLPAPLKQRIYDRLVRALHPTDPDPRYAYIDSAERERIMTILRETHPEMAKRLAAR